MTAEIGEALRGEAITWHLRIADGSVADWEAFTAWLGADPAHARAYDLIEALDVEAGVAITAAIPRVMAAANDDTVAPRAWWRGGASVAVMAAVAFLLVPQLMSARDLYQVASAPGTTRELVLASGDTITLNGDTSVMLDRKNVRFVSLERGEAAFRISHDAAKPFVVEIGDERVEDVGTVFNVVRGHDGVRIAVAQGSVVYNPGREAVRLGAGEALTDAGGAATIVLAKVDPDSVGAWRSGRLSYSAAPLATVAADLARATGERVRIAPALAARQFSGTIRLGADRAALFAEIGELLEVGVRRERDGWALVAQDRAAH